MARMARITAVGYPHHVVQRGNNKQSIFADGSDKKAYLYLLKKYTTEAHCTPNAYCLMNNHVHLLLVPTLDQALSKAMQKISLSYTQYVNRRYKRTGRLWECRYYSSVIDKDFHLWSVCKYIERNPVRAKIVANPADYAWSSASTKNPGKQSENFIEPIWSSADEHMEYLKFLNSSETEDEIIDIGNSLRNGKPVGNKEFVEKMTNG